MIALLLPVIITFNAWAAQIEAVITERTTAILVAHIAGEPADMDPIMAVAAGAADSERFWRPSGPLGLAIPTHFPLILCAI